MPHLNNQRSSETFRTPASCCPPSRSMCNAWTSLELQKWAAWVWSKETFLFLGAVKCGTWISRAHTTGVMEPMQSNRTKEALVLPPVMGTTISRRAWNKTECRQGTQIWNIPKRPRKGQSRLWAILQVHSENCRNPKVLLNHLQNHRYSEQRRACVPDKQHWKISESICAQRAHGAPLDY